MLRDLEELLREPLAVSTVDLMECPTRVELHFDRDRVEDAFHSKWIASQPSIVVECGSS